MILRQLPKDDRLLELFADDAVHGLDLHERRELRERLSGHHPHLDVDSFECTALDVTAAQVALAHAAVELAPLPGRVRERLILEADLFCSRLHSDEVVGRISPVAAAAPQISPAPAVESRLPIAPSSLRGDDRRVGRFAALGWLAAAACLTLAAIGWFNRPDPRPLSSGPLTPLVTADQLAIHAAAYQRFKKEVADVRRAEWTDWQDPEIKGVKGEVVWSDSLQTGYMRFSGLPENNGFAEQYQLWIIDERGLADESGQSMRISGGVFDAVCTGELIVPITPALKVRGAKIFALTIEKPGGTWVSDMKRRVTIAEVGA